MSGIETKIDRVCFVCKKNIEPAMGEESTFGNPPSDATCWVTHGNYGSTIFDPMIYPEYLEICICDQCIIERVDRIIKFSKKQVVEMEIIDEVKQMKSLDDISHRTFEDSMIRSAYKPHPLITQEESEKEQADRYKGKIKMNCCKRCGCTKEYSTLIMVGKPCYCTLCAQDIFKELHEIIKNLLKPSVQYEQQFAFEKREKAEKYLYEIFGDNIDASEKLKVIVSVSGPIGYADGPVYSADGFAYAKNESDLKHICGSHGYNPSLGDTCPRCKLNDEAYENAKKKIKSMENGK